MGNDNNKTSAHLLAYWNLKTPLLVYFELLKHLKTVNPRQAVNSRSNHMRITFESLHVQAINFSRFRRMPFTFDTIKSQETTLILRTQTTSSSTTLHEVSFV